MLPLRGCAAFVLLAGAAAAPVDWQARIRRDHPRLFCNRETWPAVRARALHEEAERFQAMQARVDARLTGPVKSQDYGLEAAEAAFVFLVKGDRRYAELGRRLLAVSIAHYTECYAQKRSVNWYTFSRINAWAAFDWLYNEMPQEERSRLGAEFLQAVENVQPTRARRAFDRENWGGPESGFYSTPSLLWYAGLATYRDAIDDALAASMLTRGHGLFLKLLAHRGRAAGDDGGSASGALNYSLAAYPWAEFNFFHTFRSATGLDIAADWPYVAYLPAYLFWNWLPGGREFGYGDAYHTENRIGAGGLNLHLSQIIQFYARSQPECAAFARWLLERLPREQRSTFPFARFLLTSLPDVAPVADATARMPAARHFENMGQTFLRSGSGDDDTYALFTAGGLLTQHKHFDHNNLVIYQNGFLALDSGTRPEPGQHLTHYYCRSVAHNTVLIRMPGEEMPRYWGSPGPDEEGVPVPNDGGQRTALGSKVIAFETSREYSYVAGDATATYHPDKCQLALRQLVFLPPHHFVIFDRVTAARPGYPKTWLLHTAAEPRLQGREFSAVHERGKLFCRTLLPERAQLRLVGGPGKQFFSDGRNWPLPRGYRTPDTTPLLGQWRVEVTPRAPRASDVFLHLIEVGDTSLARMAGARVARRGLRVGVRFHTGQNDWEILFDGHGVAGGHIRLRHDGKLRFDRELTRSVTPQTGLWAHP